MILKYINSDIARIIDNAWQVFKLWQQHRIQQLAIHLGGQLDTFKITDGIHNGAINYLSPNH